MTMDFSKSLNITVTPNPELTLPQEVSTEITALVPPFARVNLGKLSITDPYKAASISYSMKSSLSEPDISYLVNLKQERIRGIQEELKNAQDVVFSQSEIRDGSVYLSLDNIQTELPAMCQDHHFIDRSFPPTDESIFTSEDNQALDRLRSGQNLKPSDIIVWKRAKEIFDPKGLGGPEQQFAVFQAAEGAQDVDPNDIRQGALGDCWFMCALASLAEFPSLVKWLFRESEGRGLDLREQGMYLLSLFSQGMERLVAVDDYFPCCPGGGPVFSQSHGNELWVLLIEKAYAKLNGSYYSLRGGFSFEAFLDLLGCPYKNYDLTDTQLHDSEERKDALWRDLALYDSLNYVLSAGTPGHDTFSEGGKTFFLGGLVGGHAYTILTAKEGSGGQRLLKLRNPWGKGEWEGDWSDKSPLWTPELKEEFELVDSDDGTFWMAFSDFLSHFDIVNVAMARHDAPGKTDWTVQRTPLRLSSQPTESGGRSLASQAFVFSLSGEEEGGWDTYLSLHQKDSRDVRGSPPYIDLGLAVFQILPLEASTSPSLSLKYVSSVKSTSSVSYRRQNQLELLSLPAGTYLVIPFTPAILPSSEATPGSDSEREVTLVLHTECPQAAWTDLCPIGGDRLEELLAAICESKGQRQDYDEGRIQVYYDSCAYCHFAVRNSGPLPLKFEMSMEGSEGCVSHRGPDFKYSLRVDPGQCRLLHELVPSGDGSMSMSIGYNYQKLMKKHLATAPPSYVSPFQFSPSEEQATLQAGPVLSPEELQRLREAITQ